MRTRPTRYTMALTTRLRPEQVERLVALAEQQRRPVAEVLRDAVEQLLDDVEARAAG